MLQPDDTAFIFPLSHWSPLANPTTDGWLRVQPSRGLPEFLCFLTLDKHRNGTVVQIMKIKQKDMTLIVMKQVRKGMDCEMWHGLAVISIEYYSIIHCLPTV